MRVDTLKGDLLLLNDFSLLLCQVRLTNTLDLKIISLKGSSPPP